MYLELPGAGGVGGQGVLEAGHHAPAAHHRAVAEPAGGGPGGLVSGHDGPRVPGLQELDADLQSEPGEGEGGGRGLGGGRRGEHHQHVWA